jgi:hypothetical protein
VTVDEGLVRLGHANLGAGDDLGLVAGKLAKVGVVR